MSNALNRRLARVVRRINQHKQPEFLIYTCEVPDGNGGLILLRHSRSGFEGPPEPVGHVAAADMAAHRREVIRIERPACLTGY